MAACLNMYQNIYSLFASKIRKINELNELNELKCSKTLSQMSSYAHKHVFFYLHAQTNLNTLLHWSYLISKIEKNSIRIFRNKTFKKFLTRKIFTEIVYINNNEIYQVPLSTISELVRRRLFKFMEYTSERHEICCMKF